MCVCVDIFNSLCVHMMYIICVYCIYCVKVLVTQLCPTLQPHGTCQVPLSMGFSRQEYWSGLPFRSPGDLPNPGTELRSPALQADSLLSEPRGRPKPKWLVF